MAKLTPQQAQAKQAARLKAAIPDMKAGVLNVQVAPGQQAAAKADKMLTNLTDAVQSGRWAKRVGAVSLQDWQNAMVNKGTARVAAGIDAAADKTTAFFTQLFPFQDALVAKVKQMPDMTIEDSVQRAATMIRGMANFKKQ
jgi:hypothetical protein